ncbi:MAG: hypothetical protein DRI46_06765 [Chloroflexi bacterium]|nr:MAG: hypothetical protein DRI46_06765 [Chloroflexota bacterium]
MTLQPNYINYVVVGQEDGHVDYILGDELVYYSERYGKTKTVPKGYVSDGASGATDINGSWSWWVHDHICEVPYWDDKTPIKSWEAAQVLKDIMKGESKKMTGHRKALRRTRSTSWRWATFLFGCKKTRKNGWI